MTGPAGWLAIDWLLVAVAAWLALGALGVLRLHDFFTVARVLFPAGALVGVGAAAVAGAALLAGSPQTAVLAIGLPELPFHLRLDALAAFFVLLLALASAGVSAFAAGYFRKGEGTPPGLMCLQYHVFLAGMTLVLLADDAYAFMVAWELMALASFFLVTANHVIPAIRRAGYLYLLVAHLGAIAILLCFGVLQANTGDYTFDNMRAQQLSPFWASVAFLLAFFGFGAKAGILPLHVWLPEAHPAAPSPVSALMSGVMTKIALYGLLRLVFDLLGEPLWWWGTALLGVGAGSAVLALVHALVERTASGCSPGRPSRTSASSSPPRAWRSPSPPRASSCPPRSRRPRHSSTPSTTWSSKRCSSVERGRSCTPPARAISRSSAD
jgi:hydrogenase-4 component B